MTLTKKDNCLIVSLDASMYTQAAVITYTPFLDCDCDTFLGKITHADEERLEVTYYLPEYAESISNVTAESNEIERFELARKYSALSAWQTRIATPYLAPDNIFITGGQLKIAHRGLEGYIEPKTKDTQDFMTKYKALVVSTIMPKYTYEKLVSGNVKVRDSLCQEILSANKIEEIEDILDKQIYARRQLEKSTKRMVKKSRYAFFRLASAFLAVVILGLGIWMGITLFETVPLQERIIESQSAFIVSNYGETIRILANDNPENLPRSVQHILAVSFIQLENLSLQQRNAILNHISPLSTENELLYWIRAGRGEFYAALDLALNIGDNQLILHAYTNLFDMVYADPVMPGAEKQRLLDEYRARIDELLALFEGDEDE